MSTKISSGISNSSSFYLRNFYSNNRDASKSSKRNDFSHVELAYEDSLALKKASSKLNNHKYSDTKEDENTDENTINTIKAYVDVYNNALDSSNGSDSATMERYAKQLKKLSSKYSDELKDIGITIGSDGKMEVNDNLIKAAGNEKIKMVFGKDVGYTKSIRSITSRMNTAAYNELYSSVTGNGSKINISL